MENKYLAAGSFAILRGEKRTEMDELILTPDQESFVEVSLMEAGDLSWIPYSYLVLVLRIQMDALAGVDIQFYREEQEKPDNVLGYQMIPTQDVTILVDFTELKSERYFLKTLPGMLKGHCTGLPAQISDMRRVTMLVHPGYSTEFREVRVKECYLTNEPPAIRVDGTPMVDELGQWIDKEWDTKAGSETDMTTYLRKEYQRAKKDCSYPDGFSRYGGCMREIFDKTGYFHLSSRNGRWWLVDPDGYGFFSNGICYSSRMGVFGFVDGIESLFTWLPDEADSMYREAWTNAGEIAEYVKRNGKESGQNRRMFNFARANMIRAFGSEKWWNAWHTINTARIRRWGFNTIGVGVNNYFDEHVIEFLEKAQIPFVWTLKEFPQTNEKIFRDFPDVCSAEYRENAELFAKEQLTPFNGNPYMIGYFINNEPEWRFQEVNLAERTLAHPVRLESKIALVGKLKEQYGSIEALNYSWETNFRDFESLYHPAADADRYSEQANADCRYLHDWLVEVYESVAAESLKVVDPAHLDLGMRYSKAGAEVMGGCSKHDVFSFNCYQKKPDSVLDICSQAADVPMMIGEWHIGGGDKGSLSHGLLASPNQEERGKALEYYLQRAMSHPNCVGAHYFEMNDQPLLGRFDGECMEHGLIDVCNHQFDSLVKHLEQTNYRMYEYVTGERAPTEIEGVLERNP